ncbi:MAG: trehalose-phosphatase [Betaproteobacteria bacterium]|nr:trehalose-phosphatase [Betaproteobacteria bacterium]
MQVLTPRVDIAAFTSRIASAANRVLMLDYDGTLAPFHVRPELAAPYPEVAAILEEIVQAGGTRVVIVSGRPAAELPPLLPLTTHPEIWGSHGWERLLADGRRIVEQPGTEARLALDEAARAVEDLLSDGARVETKLASIALHWRGLPDAAAQALEKRALARWEPLTRSALEILRFDGGLELRAVGCNKQYAVKAVLSETADDTAIAYLGDDITDEDAFRAVKVRGLGILVRGEFRETAADVWLRPPDELASFLQLWRVKGER